MSDNDFGGVDLVLGSVRGYRSWQIDEKGHLCAVSHRTIWKPGENRAECLGSINRELLPKQEEGESWGDWYKRVDYAEAEKAWKADHSIADCAHGYYAFFEPENYDGYGTKPTLNGIIEGYGEVVIGTKGFRASKARILALSIEPYDGMWNLDPFFVARIRRNYPAAAIFEGTFAMLAEFPLTRAGEYAEVDA